MCCSGRACLGCCHSLVRDSLRAISALAAVAGGLLVLAAVDLVGGAPPTGPLLSWWFPAALAVAGLLLAVLGLTASIGAWCGSYGPLHVITGAFLALLPLEVAAVGLWWKDETALQELAESDPSGGLAATLEWVDAHTAAAGGLAAVAGVLQLLAVLLSTCLSCLPRRRKRHPWSDLWEEDGLSSPLLPPYGSPAATSRSGYHTPASHLASPYVSPPRPYPSSRRGSAPTEQLPPTAPPLQAMGPWQPSARRALAPALFPGGPAKSLSPDF